VILVDSGVWIDYFWGLVSPQTDKLDGLLGNEPLLVGDLILAEVLQGFAAERDFNNAKRLFDSFDLIEIGGSDVALQAARNFRTLRSMGVTVCKTIDTLIATRCIQSGYVLLHNGRDFDIFAEHLGLETLL